MLTLVNVWAALARSPQLVAREAGAGERADTVGADSVGAAGRGILTLIDIKAAFSKQMQQKTRFIFALLKPVFATQGSKLPVMHPHW